MTPFNRPALIGREQEYMALALARGHISGDGHFSRQCHAWLERELGVERALLTTSGTHALELAALLLDIQPGDEVILPAFTFVSTANAFVLRGARPIFCDIRPDTLNLDERLLRKLISPRTRAIVPVHYAGVGCEMDTILALAAEHHLVVVEDNAHGLLGRYRQRPLGSLGALAAQSFHETKNFSCGEGGALLINDPSLVERAEILREKGTDRSRFFRGQVDKYSWQDIGSSFLPSDMLAAFLLAQLEEKEAIQHQRRMIWERYAAGLREWAAAHGVQLPSIPEHCQQAYHMFYLLLPDLAARQALMAALRQEKILAVFHYLPLHLSPMGQKFGGRPGACPVTENISDRLLRLPFFYDLHAAAQERVIRTIIRFDPRQPANA
ncbi:MAG: dTDP-4-amino-4,6-dideoxygalactose transaminase [Lentisphaerae bacterium]|nr:dTDP-4-amino-4,6-dideoxygalactose transaminase [Lentisphaerota bacterium]